MGNHPNITATKYPKQGEDLGRSVWVAFHYEFAFKFPGRIIRDDIEPPYMGIIILADGRVVLTTECQYEVIREENGLVTGPVMLSTSAPYPLESSDVSHPRLIESVDVLPPLYE